jgi:hypothetical protein
MKKNIQAMENFLPGNGFLNRESFWSGICNYAFGFS